MKSTVSIKDIAKECGVSIATVSRVINKTGRYSKETEDKVMEIIRSHNYSPNQIAKGLRVQKMDNVGIILPDITNEYFNKLVYELETNLFREGYASFLCNTSENPEIERQRTRMMATQNVCGLIFLTSGLNEKDFEEINLPSVFLDRLPARLPAGCSLISSDNIQGGYLATKELLDQGCRKILILTSEEPVTSYIDRYKGYCRAMEEGGFGPEQLHKLELKSLHYYEAHQAMMELLDSGSFDYDGIFAASDWLAIGCFRALEEHDIPVPEQVKIVGYDDISITAFNKVPITTIHQQVAELGRYAVQQLMQTLKGDTQSKQTIQVPVYLVPRASTRGDRAQKYI